jgi:hypothetical protein
MDSLDSRGLGDRIFIAGALLVGGTAFYLFAISIYRLYFHPLSKYPGPTANAISWVRLQKAELI